MNLQVPVYYTHIMQVHQGGKELLDNQSSFLLCKCAALNDLFIQLATFHTGRLVERRLHIQFHYNEQVLRSIKDGVHLHNVRVIYFW